MLEVLQSVLKTCLREVCLWSLPHGHFVFKRWGLWHTRVWSTQSHNAKTSIALTPLGYLGNNACLLSCYTLCGRWVLWGEGTLLASWAQGCNKRTLTKCITWPGELMACLRRAYGWMRGVFMSRRECHGAHNASESVWRRSYQMPSCSECLFSNDGARSCHAVARLQRNTTQRDSVSAASSSLSRQLPTAQPGDQDLPHQRH